MAESIESFVEKLQNEGVEAGRQQAEKIVADAHAEAERIVQEAKQKAEKIVDDAENEARETRERAQTDMQLAARDTVLRLRETLSRALQSVLVSGAEQPLQDPEFLKGLIHDVVMQYARGDQEGETHIQISVGDQAKDQLTEWCRQQLAPQAQEAGAAVDLRGGLKEAGFEYEVEGGNVEVTLRSVVETLSDLVSPRLRERLEAATREDAADTGGEGAGEGDQGGGDAGQQDGQ
jgi:V/A-type H+-transporting ATPase subunit E